MIGPCTHQGPISRCNVPVPSELDSVGLCVQHFAAKIETKCGELHRQLALRGATPDRRREVAAYIGECALLMAQVTSNLCLSDELKRRVLTTFLCLMNLREKIERAESYPEPRVPRRAAYATPAVVAG
jgi:hypothetical protein